MIKNTIQKTFQKTGGKNLLKSRETMTDRELSKLEDSYQGSIEKSCIEDEIVLAKKIRSSMKTVLPSETAITFRKGTAGNIPGSFPEKADFFKTATLSMNEFDLDKNASFLVPDSNCLRERNYSGIKLGEIFKENSVENTKQGLNTDNLPEGNVFNPEDKLLEIGLKDITSPEERTFAESILKITSSIEKQRRKDNSGQVKEINRRLQENALNKLSSGIDVDLRKELLDVVIDRRTNPVFRDSSILLTLDRSMEFYNVLGEVTENPRELIICDMMSDFLKNFKDPLSIAPNIVLPEFYRGIKNPVEASILNITKYIMNSDDRKLILETIAKKGDKDTNRDIAKTALKEAERVSIYGVISHNSQNEYTYKKNAPLIKKEIQKIYGNAIEKLNKKIEEDEKQKV